MKKRVDIAKEEKEIASKRVSETKGSHDSRKSLGDHWVFAPFPKDEIRGRQHIQLGYKQKDPLSLKDPLTDDKYTHPWYVKKSYLTEKEESVTEKSESEKLELHVANLCSALLEVVAQEFFRLILPSTQPKTRIGVDESGRYAVLSKGVAGFTPLVFFEREDFISEVENRSITGLGKVALLSLFFEEIDLNTKNLGINDKKICVKIDGDCCFASFRNFEKFTFSYPAITQKELAMLPFIASYPAYHWLGCVEKTLKKVNQGFVTAEMAANPSIRNEINQATAMLLFLPSTTVNKFIQHYTNFSDPMAADVARETGRKLFNWFLISKEILLKAACKEKSFCQWMRVHATPKFINTFYRQLEKFKLTEKKFLPITREEFDAQVNFIKATIAKHDPLSSPDLDERLFSLSDNVTTALNTLHDSFTMMMKMMGEAQRAFLTAENDPLNKPDSPDNKRTPHAGL